MRRAVLALVVVVGLVLGLAACGSSGGIVAGAPAAPAPTGPGAGGTPGSGSASGPTAAPVRPVVAQPPHGRLLWRSIPGLTSGFVARPALVYLPPFSLSNPTRRLPVLILLHGTSGGPIDWVRKAGLPRLLSAFAAAHGGAAPIVVMPDINGSLHADSECVGRSEQYLAVDVPRYVAAHFPATTAHAHWAVAGLSEGGTCALMLSLRHPRVFPTFGDFGGLLRPTVGDYDAPVATTEQLFGGSRSAFDAHDPSWLLTHHRYPTLTGWFECGTADRTLRIQRIVVRLSRAAGLTVVARTTPGGHIWPVWARASMQLLTWFWARAT